ncbi:MAG: ATP-dependent Clp protease ATP-binding subunit ClpA [Legionellales bacterium]|nr:ATP-dependent Clp protease ATP-binding subunit ClpA [Legionellales bacterium]
MFSRTLENTINDAFERARERRHKFITTEHLLLSLLDDPDAFAILNACNVNLDAIRTGLKVYIQEKIPRIEDDQCEESMPTLSYQRVLQRSIFQVQAAGKSEVNGADVLLALFGEAESAAVYFLSQENITRMSLLNLQNSSENEEQVDHTKGFNDSFSEDSMLDSAPNDQSLERYAINVNERVRLGRIDPLIGRDHEVERVVQVLLCRRKNNPLLVGEAGVGKTAIAEGLAYRIFNGQVPAKLQKSTVYSLDLGSLLAGTKYRGDFEKRFKVVLNEFTNNPNAIIFIDEIHSIIGAGAASGGALDAANLLKPFLSSGQLKCIGATTYSEYRNIFSKDSALTRRFQKIDVVETTKAQTEEIINGLLDKYECHHSVKYAKDAVRHAVELSVRYLQNKFLPDKAIDVVDEAGAEVAKRIVKNDKKTKTVTKKDIEHVVSRMSRVPVSQFNLDSNKNMMKLSTQIHNNIFGQNDAIEAVCRAIKINTAGLRDCQRPIGSFLFTGPTGVGKTELCVQLANAMGLELIRFDMSEYMEKHAVSQLIGAPPGYVGYEQGGALTDAVMKHPYSVVLLDEIEKAHQEVYNLLLQVMDYGHLTDSMGRVTNFNHVVLVMTSNVGATISEKNLIGFSHEQQFHDPFSEISRFFSPEFRNRLDAVIHFNRLEHENLLHIVDKQLNILSSILDEKSIKIKCSNNAKKWLVENGYDIKMGARPIKKLIDTSIKSRLADLMLKGKAKKGSEVLIKTKGNELDISLN